MGRCSDCRRRHIDLNGNGMKDESDRYGISYCDNSNTLVGYFYSASSKLIVRGADGYHKLNIDTEKSTRIVDKR